MVSDKLIAMAVEAMDIIDTERAKIRDARNALAESESVINLAMARLHAFVAMLEAK